MTARKKGEGHDRSDDRSDRFLRNDLTEFFNYPKGIRRAIYTTNAIESLNFS